LPEKKKSRWTALYVSLLVMFLLHLGVIFFMGHRQPPEGQKAGRGVQISRTEEKGAGAEKALLQSSAQKHMEEANFQAALADYESLLSLDPASTDALEGKGSALVGLGRWNETVQLMNGLLKRNPGNVNALLNRSAAYLAMGQREKALSDRFRARELAPGSPHVSIELGRTLSESGQYGKSLEILDEALKLAPTPKERAAIHLAQGYAALHLSQREKAEAFVKQAMATGESRDHAYFLLMEIYLDMNDRDRALKMYEEYRRLDPGETLIHRLGDRINAIRFRSLGSIYWSRGSHEEAQRLYDMAARLDPDSTDTALCRLLLLAQEGNTEEARRAALAWKGMKPGDPENPEEMSDYAIAWALAGDRQKALFYADEAVKNAPGRTLYLANGAFARLLCGDEEEFRRQYALFLQKAPRQEVEYVEGLFKDNRRLQQVRRGIGGSRAGRDNDRRQK